MLSLKDRSRLLIDAIMVDTWKAMSRVELGKCDRLYLNWMSRCPSSNASQEQARAHCLFRRYLVQASLILGEYQGRLPLRCRQQRRWSWREPPSIWRHTIESDTITQPGPPGFIEAISSNLLDTMLWVSMIASSNVFAIGCIWATRDKPPDWKSAFRFSLVAESVRL